MKKTLGKKGVAVSIVLLFLCVSIASGFGKNINDIDEQNIITMTKTNNAEKTVPITLSFYGKSGIKKQTIVVSFDDATKISGLFNEMKSSMTTNPSGEKTQQLQNQFLALLEEIKVVPTEISKEAYLSLLNPRWVERLQKTGNTASLPQPFANRGTCALCSMGGEGSGILLPLFLLPRPRIAMLWLGTGLSTAANLLTSKGYIAEGAQTGFAFGFMGIGISYALPGYTLYGFIGYSLLTSTTAEYVEHYPPNRAPVISDVLPADGEQNAPISLSELQFRIQDPDGDLMSYSVTTEPDIGSGHGNLKPFGLYTVPISGLAIDKIYRWTVEVTDGAETTTATYGFFTEGRPPFDPFTQGWNYQKKITIDHNQVTGDLTNFPVLLSVIDIDLREKAQNDGDDILFMDSSGVATKLYHEIEYFDSSTGMLTAWVNIPIVHSTEDTSLYMYYGNPSSNNQQFSEKTWDAKYLLVYHMKDETSSTIKDSTRNDNDGTKCGTTYPVESNGKIGKAQYFDGIVSGYMTSNKAIAHGSNPFTYECWYKADSYGHSEDPYPTDQYAPFFTINPPGQKNNVLAIVSANRTVNSVTKDRYRCYFQGSGASGYSVTDNLNHFNDVWNYATVARDNAALQLKIYINGSLDTVVINALTSGYNIQTYNLEIGGVHNQYPNRMYYEGFLDEVRVSSITRSPEWISTSFNNQQDPGSFLSIGPEEPGP